MARVTGITGQTKTALRVWRMAVTAAGAAAGPRDLDAGVEWVPATVPGTAAAALRTAGLFDAARPRPLHDCDVWYATEPDMDGAFTLRLGGLATLAEVWLDGARLLTSDNMFHAHEMDVVLRSTARLAICFRSLWTHRSPARHGDRPRWKASLMTPAMLRGLRTTLLGHMPGWCPDVHAVGPWRPVELVRQGSVRVARADLRTDLDAGDGVMTLDLSLHAPLPARPPALLHADGASTPLAWRADDRLGGTMRIAGVRPWWPHTHGTPSLVDVTVRFGDGTVVELGRVGFRRIAVQRADGGFALTVNGVKVFCRGACWSTADVVALPGERAAYRPWLERLRDAGMNMVRVGGTMAYETADFFALCDELGILVWQDFMFANMDYPAGNRHFMASVAEEARQMLDRQQASPSLAVLCGGSEVAQQAAMLGLPPGAAASEIFDSMLPALCADLRPDVPYVAHTPGGSDVPFVPETGVSHYYGVGAYQRPLDDARRARVRFAAECLAFSNVPTAATLAEALPVPPVHHPEWKRRVPRDPGAAWDFEDVREHYMRALFGIDPAALRRDDADAYLRAARATVAEAMQAVFAEWRRAGSTCGGGLVWMLQDVWPGAGWGIIDSFGRPKSAWHALRHVLQPVQVLLTDEGSNGLHVHLINETAQPVAARLALRAVGAAPAPLASGERATTLPPRSAATINGIALLPGFFDLNRAYRFGPPAHDGVVATLRDAASGTVLSEAFHFPPGIAAADPAIAARVVRDDRGWSLDVSAQRLARWVHIEDDGFAAEDDWFHLAPGDMRRVRLHGDPARPPSGRVHALNAPRPARYAATAAAVAA
jgi:beta-mannosidase